MHNNPFHCDCHLLDFSSWLQLTGVPLPSDPTCHTPQRLQVHTAVSSRSPQYDIIMMTIVVVVDHDIMMLTIMVVIIKLHSQGGVYCCIIYTYIKLRLFQELWLFPSGKSWHLWRWILLLLSFLERILTATFIINKGIDFDTVK